MVNFQCTKAKILNMPTPKAITANYKTIVPLKGDPYSSTVAPVELDMKTGFFDTGANCSLD